MWERAFTKHFKIYVADELTQSMINNLKDNVYGDDSQASTLTNDFTDAGWTMVADVTQESYLQSQIVEVTSGTKGRYVAIECIERGTVWGNSFWEFSVYDSPEEVAKLSKITLSCDNTEGSTSQSFTINTSFKDQYDVNYTLIFISIIVYSCQTSMVLCVRGLLVGFCDYCDNRISHVFRNSNNFFSHQQKRYK